MSCTVSLLKRVLTTSVLPCRRENSDLWFSDRPAELEEAKAFCRECPVRLKCLAGAFERREPWGVWGGEIFVNGVTIARKRPRGRPRKYPAHTGPALVGRRTAEIRQEAIPVA